VRAGGAASGEPTAILRKAGKDDARILDNQAALQGTDVEIPALEGTLLATRKEAVKRRLLSQASFDASLALSQAMTMLQPAVAGKKPVDRALQERAAVASRQLFVALQRETADEKNFAIQPSYGEGSAIMSENPYTGELRVTTYFLWMKSEHTASWLEQLPGLIRQGKWDDAFRGYRKLLDGLDLWVANELRKKGKGSPEEALGNAQEHYSQLRTGLEQIATKHATRLPALFHLDPETVEAERAAGRPATDTVPMNVYFWKDKEDGKFHIYDLTAPSQPHEQVVDRQPTAVMMNTFFEEVARYPKGEVRFQLPGGAGGVAPTTGKVKWYEWAGYAGLAVAAVGLAFFTAGASVPATVCFAAGTLAGGIAAGGHLVDSVQLGTATTATVVLDVAQVVASFASFGALSITLQAGSAAAALSSSRWFIPLTMTAASADVVQLAALSEVTYTELDKVQKGPGNAEDKQRAMSVLLTQLIVMGGLTVLSVRGARDVHVLAGKPLELIEQNGAKVLHVVGEDAPAMKSGEQPSTAKPTSLVSSIEGTAPKQADGARLARTAGYPDAEAGYHWAAVDDRPVYKRNPGSTGPKRFFDAADGQFKDVPKQWDAYKFSDLGKKEPCFAPGTRVKTPAGDRAIEDLRAGDEVLAFCVENNRVVARRVTRVVSSHTAQLVRLSVASELISATRLHRFWIPGEDRYVRAMGLELATPLYAVDGGVEPITSLELDASASPTFNLEVEHDHNYFVGSRGFLVHNGDESSFASSSRTDIEIYAVFDKQLGKYIYVGQTEQGMWTRFEQHLATKPAWQAREAHLEVRLVQKGSWSAYDAAVWELHFIEKYRAEGNPLENLPKGNPIGETKFARYHDLQNPCR
jgi:hypothetical protein